MRQQPNPPTEYLRRNLMHAKTVGAIGIARTLIEKLKKRKRVPKWLIAEVTGIFDRIYGLDAEMASWRNTAPDRPEYISPDRTGLYLLQDTRQSVGNCPVWWSRVGGYTTRIDMAQRYSKEDAMRQHNSRETDLPWAAEEIECLWQPVVDVQYMPRDWEAQRSNLRNA